MPVADNSPNLSCLYRTCTLILCLLPLCNTLRCHNHQRSSGQGCLCTQLHPDMPYTIAFHKEPFRWLSRGHQTLCGTTTSRGTPLSELAEESRMRPKHLWYLYRFSRVTSWLFYLPSPLGTHYFTVSRDAVFDEVFEFTILLLTLVHSPIVPPNLYLNTYTSLNLINHHSPPEPLPTTLFASTLLPVQKGKPEFKNNSQKH